MVNVFAVPVFFICFRECLESSIIVSILLSFLKQSLGPDRDPAVYKRLVKQVWLGVGLGLLVCIIVGAGMIGAFYGLQSAAFSKTEEIWEGVFALVASIIISVMGAALLRVSKLQDKWRVKIARAIEAKESSEKLGQSRLSTWSQKYAMFILPFVTVLREGLEAVVFIGGVGVGLPASSFPIAVLTGLGAGALIGFLMYKGANAASMQIFLIVSTCFLYLVAAGLLSRGVWSLENNTWNKVIGGDAAETGAGPGSYDIRQSVWHINCCSPKVNGGGGWGVFSSLLGWQNSATYGSVISYNLYWLVVIGFFVCMGYQEKTGHWPLMKAKTPVRAGSESSSQGDREVETEKTNALPISSNVREVSK